MSDAKFTPPPWSFIPGLSVLVVKGTQGRVAIVGREEYWEHFSEESLANAHLISTAPDLYSVLQELEESVDYWSEYDVPIGIQDRIKNVLKKARGEA